MGLVSYSFELLPLTAALILFAVWAYRFIFNHDIIRNYIHRQYVSKAKVNALIDSTNKQFGTSLRHVDVEGETLEPTLLPHLTTKSYAEIHQKNINKVVRVLFSLVIALSLELVLLLMVQLTGSFEIDLPFFKFNLRTLVVLVTMVQPLLVVSLYVNQDLLPSLNYSSPAAISKTISTLALCVGWFMMLGRVGSMASSLGQVSDKTFLEEKTNEIVLTGITITAVLSGVGCTLTPIQNFWTNRRTSVEKPGGNGPLRESQLNTLIQSYNSTKMLVGKRARELESLRIGKTYNSPPVEQVRLLRGSGKQFFHKVQSFTSLPKFGRASEEEELQQEIVSLNELKDLIYSDLTKNLDKFLAAKLTSSSSSGFSTFIRLFNLAFSCYCVYRIINVLFIRLPFRYFWDAEDLHDAANNIIDDKEASSTTLNKNTKDALAITIAKIIQSVFGYLPISETQLINQVSFILSGSLFMCSFQNVLTTFKSFGRILPATTTTVSHDVKSWLKNLVVSEFLAIYVIATALLIRSNLPPETAKLMLRVLSLTSSASSTTLQGMQNEVEFIDAWFDKVFGITCLATFVVIAMKSFIESDNIYHDGYDEEMFIEDGRAKMS